MPTSLAPNSCVLHAIARPAAAPPDSAAHSDQPSGEGYLVVDGLIWSWFKICLLWWIMNVDWYLPYHEYHMFSSTQVLDFFKLCDAAGGGGWQGGESALRRGGQSDSWTVWGGHAQTGKGKFDLYISATLILKSFGQKFLISPHKWTFVVKCLCLCTFFTQKCMWNAH